jgi:ABC-type sugar transport system substrate-binding protein
MSRERSDRQLDDLITDYLRGRISRRDLAKQAGRLGGLGIVLAALAPELRPAAAQNEKQPITDMTNEELLKFYDEVLPFKDLLPLEAGEVGGSPIVIGFSQTGFNHPWRVEMIKSAQAEIARHPNVSMIITDGNVDIRKQNNDVDDLSNPLASHQPL